MANYDYINQSIVSSASILIRDNDSFFHPTLLHHSGYAYDGYMYTLGVKGSQQSSWSLESESSFRGVEPAFPTQGLAILSDTALTIFSQEDYGLVFWMLFIVGDTYSLPSNYTSGTNSFYPSSISYNLGVISVVYNPDAGSVSSNPFVLRIDFVQDSTYIETAA